MKEEDYIHLSDEEKIELIKKEKDEQIKLEIIRTLSSDDLMMQCVNLLAEESEKSAVTYSLSNLENKVKIIESLTEEKWITCAIIELPSNEYKIKMLSRVKNLFYKNCIIQSLDTKDKNIKKELDTIEDEKDLASILSKIEDKDLKYYYLDRIKDEKNKSKIVISLKDEKLTEEYIEKVHDRESSTLLKASLADRTKRNKLLDINNSLYSNIEVPEGITIGIEIESEGKGSIDAYVIDDILEGYHAKVDNSLQDGVEITSPILNNSREHAEDIYCVCKILKELGQSISERCGGHIHIGADYLKTKEAYRNLLELWSNNEALIYLISNKEGEIPREDVVTYALPISKKIEEAIKDDRFNTYEDLSKEDMIRIIQRIQEGQKEGESIRTGINFLTVNSNSINTIEFRISNGIIDADTWIENATLFGNMVAVSQKLGEIQLKEDITEDEKTLLDKFELLKTKDISNEDRLNIFLDLCVPDRLRQVFIDRYTENSKRSNTKTIESLGEHISDKPINILSGIDTLASSRKARNIEGKEAELIRGYLEHKKSRYTSEKASRE